MGNAMKIDFLLFQYLYSSLINEFQFARFNWQRPKEIQGSWIWVECHQPVGKKSVSPCSTITRSGWALRNNGNLTKSGLKTSIWEIFGLSGVGYRYFVCSGGNRINSLEPYSCVS